MKLISLKKRFCLCVVLVLLLQILLPACSSEESEPLYPPVRSTGKLLLTYIDEFSFDTAFEEAALVAHVRVKSWEAEHGVMTLYTAEIIDRYKGKSPSEIHFIQAGCSTNTSPGCPLFIPGNELLLFFTIDEQASSTFGVDTAYFPINDPYTTCYILRDDNKTEYIAPQNSFFTDPINHLRFECDDALKTELLENLKESDPIWNERNKPLDHIYKLKDIEKYFKKLK